MSEESYKKGFEDGLNQEKFMKNANTADIFFDNIINNSYKGSQDDKDYENGFKDGKNAAYEK